MRNWKKKKAEIKNSVDMFNNRLAQGSANFLCKGPDSRYFRLHGLTELSKLSKYAIHRQYANTWAQPCSHEALFTTDHMIAVRNKDGNFRNDFKRSMGHEKTVTEKEQERK